MIKIYIYNIINFDNGVLLGKAKDKLLFLSFCIEYKKFSEFLNNDSMFEFSTYLPIQLDATCNVFQHLALFSRESSLYEVLNLTNINKTPNDFYILDFWHKLVNKVKNVIPVNITAVITNKTIVNIWVKVVRLKNPPYKAIPLLKSREYKLLYTIKVINKSDLITILENNMDLLRIMVTAFEINSKINKKINISMKKVIIFLLGQNL